jgi:hypothetical protein
VSETHQDAQCEMKSHPRIFAGKGFFQTLIRRGCLRHFMQQSTRTADNQKVIELPIT